MAISNHVLEGSIPSLLQGVSQQVPRERLDGQVGIQVNMVSDVVNGMRRRPGARMLKADVLNGATLVTSKIYCAYHSAGGIGRHVIVNTSTGKLEVFDNTFTSLGSLTNAYLQSVTAQNIQSISLRGRVYVVNTEVIPTGNISNSGKQNPNLTGFFFIKTGAYSKTYSVNITTSGGTYTVSYTTPDGTTAGDAALSTPTYIATQLVNAINAKGTPFVTPSQSSGYVFLICTGSYNTLTVSTDSGISYMSASNQSSVSLVSDLPALLPTAGYNCMCAVGSTVRTAVWYRYNGATGVWLEDSAWNSITSITNICVSYSLYGSVDIQLETGEGRLAGSDETNENPAFLDVGITGLSAYQGRLVLLCGSEVVMSAAGKPMRFYRSTVTELLDEDPIGIMAGGASAADFMYAMQFNRDLLLFSSTCQAVIPGTNVPISPSTAQIVLTSSYAGDNNSSPVDTGRSIMFPVPISGAFAGFFEMIPSNYTASQYTSLDITQHIPKYMPGRVLKCVGSTNVGMLLSICSGDSIGLYVHQFKWNNETKIQGAWHRWEMPYPIASVWFADDTIIVALNANGKLALVTVELQTGTTINGLYRPLSDIYQSVTVTNGQFTVPEVLRSAYNSGYDILLTYTSGTLSGAEAGVESINTSTWVGTVLRNIPDGTYFIGLDYTSVLSPTAPVLKDQDGNVFGMDATLVRYILHTVDTGEFDVYIYNSALDLVSETLSPVYNASPDLQIDYPLIGTLQDIPISVHSVSQDTTTIFSCSGASQMCFLGIDYIMRYYPRRRRV